MNDRMVHAVSDDITIEMRSAKEGEPWSEWFIESVPAPLLNLFERTPVDLTITYTYRNGFRDEFRRVIPVDEIEALRRTP